MVQHDVDSDSSIEDAIGEALAEAGRIDFPVNDAALPDCGRWERNYWPWGP
jgi:hypothetical protein